MNPITEKRSVSGYYYAEDREYVYFVTDAPREQNYRFIFDAGAIYSQDDANGEVRLGARHAHRDACDVCDLRGYGRLFYALCQKAKLKRRDKI